MGMGLMGLGGIFFLVTFVCAIIIAIHAFKNGGALHGILCLICGLYTIYWGFAKFEHPKKMLIVGGLIAGIVLGNGFIWGGAAMMAKDMAGQIESGQFQQELAP